MIKLYSLTHVLEIYKFYNELVELIIGYIHAAWTKPGFCPSLQRLNTLIGSNIYCRDRTDGPKRSGKSQINGISLDIPYF